MPKRVQMTRRKGGWRKAHPDAVIVARPSKWGNPYRWEGFFRHGQNTPAEALAAAVAEYREWITGDSFGASLARARARRDLRGKDLACWCPLDGPCHADVLLKIANEDPTP